MSVRFAGRVLRAAALVAVPVLALAGWASPAAADTTLEVTTPADGRYQPGAVTPLLVTVRADRAVTGTLSASFEGLRSPGTRVEVPGGSTKQVVLLAATPAYNVGAVVAFTSDDGRSDSSARVNLVPAGADELVAVLPSLAQGRDVPATAKLNVDVGVARLFRFEPGLLAAGGEVLSPFSQLVAAPGELAQLPALQLDAVRSWLATSGGTLVVDGPPGDGLPAGLAPEGAAAAGADPRGVAVGAGRLRFTGGRAGAGAWDGLLQPTVSRSQDEGPFGVRPNTVVDAAALAADAGVRVLAIGALVGLLGLYTVLVGPVLWLVLRRTRRETALWVALPGLALLTTLGVYALGRALRSGTSTAHATIVADLPAARVRWSTVLVSSANGGRAGVRLDAGWHPVPTEDTRFFDNGSSGVPLQRLDGADLVADIPPGGAALASAERTGPAEAPSWSFDLEAEGGKVTGTVTNRSGRRLEEVVVVSGQGFATLPPLEPGASAPVSLFGTDQPVTFDDDLAARAFTGGFSAGDTGPANEAAVVSWLARRPALRAPGVVVAIGWTRGDPGPVPTLGGGRVEQGRTAYLTAAPVAAGAAGTGWAEVLRGGSTQVGDRLAGVCNDKGLSGTLRITDPAAGSGRPLLLAIAPGSISAFDLWDGTAWRPGGLADAAQGAEVRVAVPAAAVASGSVYLRVSFGCQNFGNVSVPVLRPAQPGETVLTLGRLGGPATVATTGSGRG